MVPESRTIVWTEMDSPVGGIRIAATKNGVCRLDFAKGDERWLHLERWSKEWLGNVHLERNDEALTAVTQQLREYFVGRRRSFDVELDLYGTSFQKLVWAQLWTIPYGELRSYKEVAQGMGAAKAVRAVGGANNKNPVPIIVPCHRVVGSNGSLVGYGAGLDIKETLLTLEGSLPSQARA
ncbi:methylated-DNA--[protein]-cysteine S-methyltransferase [Desmospora activa]|uniref:Methylated-DNA--protein-cysteine methyltransferase n=1 Tax=Desmospora activa DSM 45169 TaxID=1121389 RepID=A0A2T4Z7T1_9BACL|nr:methylated-DNA--[protein]-cysteine S-methyltransferase [Desmospora activa]PTM57943.1 methylated-DNA-[protein]-cysteine S-methyltransferase [Desmospora activa DSM 45169]